MEKLERILEKLKKVFRPAGAPPDGDNPDGARASMIRPGEEPIPGIRLRAVCRGHTRRIKRIAWSPCGRFIASPSWDRTIRLWDAESGECLAVLEGHEGSVNDVSWSPDGDSLVSGGNDGTVRLWRLAPDALGSGPPVRIRHSSVVYRHSGRVSSVAWSPDRRWIASASIFGEDPVVLTDMGKPTLSSAPLGIGAFTNTIAFSPDGSLLATGSTDDARIWRIGTGISKFRDLNVVTNVRSVAFSPDGSHLATSWVGLTIGIWNVRTGQRTQMLEGPTRDVSVTAFSADGRLFAGLSGDGHVYLWQTDSWSPVTKLQVTRREYSEVLASHPEALTFHPHASQLATPDEDYRSFRIWDMDIPRLLGHAAPDETIQYTAAKIVLVGESNVGKSCLAMRMAEGRYPEDHEHGTTHGMRFWPLAAEELHPTAKPPEGARRAVVLWDFGGQDEYRLVHQLFLHDTTLALILMDPTRGRAALDEARDWNKRLEKHLKGREAVKLLVGAKQDAESPLVNRAAIDGLCKECGFAGYIETSARTGRNMDELRERMAQALDWDNLARTSRPALFQRIRDEIERRRKDGQVVVLLDDLKTAIEKAHPEIYEEDAVGAVTDQLAMQGLIARTRLKAGEQVLVLQLPVIEQYAGSLVVTARAQQRGIAALEERFIVCRGFPLPGVKQQERLMRLDEELVLECVVQLMIEHGLCFRHEGLYVFPSLFRAGERDRGAEGFPHAVSLYYDFAGAVDNIYAALVAWLFLAKGFGGVRLWENRAEFRSADQGACGVRKVAKGGGFAHLDVYFEAATPEETRTLFVSFVEDHLRRSGLDVVERLALKCACGYEFDEAVVQKRYKRGDTDVDCQDCDGRVAIAAGAERAREHDPELTKRTVALRTTVEAGKQQEADRVRAVFDRAREGECARTIGPIRILHLSDLHFQEKTDVRAKRQPLIADLRDEAEGLGVEGLDCLVISGDVVHKGTPGEFDKAREFVSGLIEAFGLSGRRCILAPGNHDIAWDEPVYDWRPARAVDVNQLTEGAWVEEGRGYLVRDEGRYPQRLRNFSEAFFHPLTQGAYPLDYGEQGMAQLLEGERVQFLAFNSCWAIDEFFPHRSGLHLGAVVRCLAEADRQLKQEKLTSNSVLRVAVWHHPVTGQQQMENTDFTEQLRQANVRLALHGHVHEDRTDLVGYVPGLQGRSTTRNTRVLQGEATEGHCRGQHRALHIAGAGSFGVWRAGRPPGAPQLYNLMEVKRDFSAIRVHTRYKDKEDGAWRGRAIWPGPDRDTKRTYYTVGLGDRESRT
uniref:Small GTP-binding protein domain-containing protein n=1 Tax=Candidatus Kentrum eta TaxID=2126337 RepID=A0A450UNQ9_9GAMM|nr:MAG: small GTP-binding protein domain-containing protein [Candidatus Kentron sp. H]VFJ94166.1 MAG: small GTP-binding protein domain-containing protein [Candidatus Kentron sp. H]VFK00759.1 MAG: small GTP-binding protein domain-containing protein [Candidatus Kentron sp. H]